MILQTHSTQRIEVQEATSLASTSSQRLNTNIHSKILKSIKIAQYKFTLYDRFTRMQASVCLQFIHMKLEILFQHFLWVISICHKLPKNNLKKIRLVNMVVPCQLLLVQINSKSLSGTWAQSMEKQKSHLSLAQSKHNNVKTQ